MEYMVIQHRVENFDRWKAAFDANAQKHDAVGLGLELLLRDVDDASMVVIVFQVDDLDKARAFAASAELRQRMADAGVIGEPVIHFRRSA